MEQNQPVPYSDEVACDACGKFGAFTFEGETLCGDCYQGRGSCCAEREIGSESNGSYGLPARAPSQTDDQPSTA